MLTRGIDTVQVACQQTGNTERNLSDLEIKMADTSNVMKSSAVHQVYKKKTVFVCGPPETHCSRELGDAAKYSDSKLLNCGKEGAMR